MVPKNTDENADILPPNTVKFGYRVLEFVGEGTWAYVYKAQHPNLPMFVAIKQLKPEWVSDENALQRFLREADVVARLKHPNVVRILSREHDEKDGLHYIFTEFAEKGTLADRLEQSPTGLPIDEVVHIAMGICSGLEAVHRKGVVHRDIKPNNILMFDVGESRDTPKLSDFGLAKVPTIAGIEPPKSTGIYGLIYYMSPEHLDGDVDVDSRSDIYSLGVLLYELLAGQVPFSGDVKDVFWAHMYVAPTPPSDFRSDIPEWLEKIVLKALCKDRRERYQSAADMYEALKEIADILDRGQHGLTSEVLLEQGLVQLESQEWEKAIDLLRQADVLRPGDERVIEALKKARDPQGLERLYNEGVQYLATGNWESAQECLAQVMGYDPDYADGQAREQLDRASHELECERRRRHLAIQYNTGMGHFRHQHWALAITDLEVVAQDPEFEDAVGFLEEARRYLKADRIYEEVHRRKEQGEWEKVVDLLEEIEQLAPPHIDVDEELRHSRRERTEARQRHQLAAWYADAVAEFEAGNLESARVGFQKIHQLQSDYRGVVGWLEEIEKQTSLKQIFERASKCEQDCDWEGAIEAYQKILDIDRLNAEAGDRLARAIKCAIRGYRGVWGHAVVKVQRWWDNRAWYVRATLMGFFDMIVIALCVGVALAFVPDVPDHSVGCFCLECWQHGGELDQTVQCDGGQSFAVLGSPGYECAGGVPVGEAWIRQPFQVPETVSPTLSLRYRIFSYDLDEYDFFQVDVNGQSVGQFGNTDWEKSDCDREVWDSGWRSAQFDLSAYSGQTITVTLRNVNGMHEWYNTWTYVDDAEIR